jgi:hypothetical protein
MRALPLAQLHWAFCVSAGSVGSAQSYFGGFRHELAAYACRLDRLKEARHWIGKAIELGGDTMKFRALVDPALAKVWEE